MIGTIRRHQRWLWFIIIAATIVSFTSYLSPSRKYNSGIPTTEVDLGSIAGTNITVEQYQNAKREAAILFRFRFGEWPDSEEKLHQANFDMDSAIYRCLLIEYKLKQMKIEATTTAAAALTRQILGVPQDAAVPMDKFNEFVQNDLIARGGVSAEDFDRFIRHQAAEQQLTSLIAMNGKLITPDEAACFYRRENESMLADAVFFPYTNYLASITPTEKDVQGFYTTNMAAYRLPDRIQLNYIKFPASNYLAAADKELAAITNLDERLDQTYLQVTQQNPKAFTNESGALLTADQAKAKIKEEFRARASLNAAYKAASSLINDLYKGHDNDHPFTTAALFNVASSNNFTVLTTEPFDQRSGAPELIVPAKTLRTVFALRDDDPDDKARDLLYPTAPLPGEDAVYVVGLNKRIPSHIQTLESIHDKVVNNYKSAMAIEMAKEAGKKLAAAAQAALTNGQTFAAVCVGQGVAPTPLSPIAMTTRGIPEIEDKTTTELVQETLYTLPAGHCSDFVPTADGGFVLFLKARLPVDEAALKHDLPVFLARMRDQRQAAAFSVWLQRQMQDVRQPIHEHPKAAGPVG